MLCNVWISVIYIWRICNVLILYSILEPWRYVESEDLKKKVIYVNFFKIINII